MEVPETPPATDEAAAQAPVAGEGRFRRGTFAALTVGAVGVVFGDIGTSPIYALREALAHSRPVGPQHIAVLGVVSLIVWTLILIVTLKYIVFLMRADNKGEGGSVALMTLAQSALGRRSGLLFLLGIVGVALFYGDGVITPAFSVLSAVEGLESAPHLGHILAPYVLATAAGLLVALFAVQRTGTHRVAALFGPVMVLWFLTLGALGVLHLVSDGLTILRAANPYYAARFLIENGFVGFVILGSVFLAVTGAEALYADMGQFGKRPIRAAWFWLVFPCLVLNYLGQGALVLSGGDRHNPFFRMVPAFAYWPVLIVATAAAVIASQAVITGAFSMTRQAVQVGLLPRIDIKRTSQTQSGQIFVPAVNVMMMVGVLVLLVVFQSSHRLASAYGIAVTGTMFMSTVLAYVVVRHLWKWRLAQTALVLGPIAFVDLTFLASNLFKVRDGGWMPLALGGGLVVVMWTWSRGLRILTDKTRSESVPLADLIAGLTPKRLYRQPGTAIFLTSSPDLAPVALLHNLKHNKVLHQKNVILTVETAETPTVAEDSRIRIEPINADFKRVVLSYGFMESPNVPKSLARCRKLGLTFDIMATTFFLGRRSIVPDVRSGMPMWQDRLFIFLTKNAANPTDFFKIPPGRVVELGAQVTV